MSAPIQTPETQASVGELVAQLGDQTSHLVQVEIEHARAELRHDVRHAGIGLGMFTSAGLLAFFGLATLIAAAVAGLAVIVDVWLAALVLGAALLVLAGVAALLGKRETAEAGPPVRTARSVREDVAVAKGGHR